MSRSLVVNLFWLAFGILVAATVIGLVTLWPDDGTIERPPELRAPATHPAEVTAIAAAPCPAPGQRGCRKVGIELLTLGVLDDLTVTQASIVLALPRASPELGFGDLFRSAVTVGHDHIAATVNTLVLAYAGASLPILLIFSLSDTSFGTGVSSEAVASEIVATLVGSIGLIAAVPLVTAFAAMLVGRMRAYAIPDAHAGHAH